MNKNMRIFLAGHRGMVGSAIMNKLKSEGFTSIITVDKDRLDLRSQLDTFKYLNQTQPEYIILAAAKVGGIQANINSPATFLYDNLQIQNNVISAAIKIGVKKIIFLGSSCIYPKNCPQPMQINHLMSGPLEPTNEGYAIAKLTGLYFLKAASIEYSMDNLTVIPCNLYGPNDSFDPVNSHVFAALIRKIYEAKLKNDSEIMLWGTGKARREFMHVEDFADALYFLMLNYNDDNAINVGVGYDISVSELAQKISEILGYTGIISWDTSKPEGMMQKCLDISTLNDLGYRAKRSIDDGIKNMIDIYSNIRSPK